MMLLPPPPILVRWITSSSSNSRSDDESFAALQSKVLRRISKDEEETDGVDIRFIFYSVADMRMLSYVYGICQAKQPRELTCVVRSLLFGISFFSYRAVCDEPTKEKTTTTIVAKWIVFDGVMETTTVSRNDSIPYAIDGLNHHQ